MCSNSWVAAATKRIGVNAAARLADTDVDVTDQAIDACPGRRTASQTRRIPDTRRSTVVRHRTDRFGDREKKLAGEIRVHATKKPRVATTSLAGCFGCHMSLLDIDERILQLIELVDFDKSPIDDLQGDSPSNVPSG